VNGLAELIAQGVIGENVDLASLTTYKLGGPARYLMQADDEEHLLQLAQILRDEPLPVVVLGRGSNVVVSAEGFPGIVVRLGLVGFSVGDEGTVEAGGALSLPMLARRSAEIGRGGLEFMAGIPGSVGGAVRMNAGSHGSDTAEWLVSARVVALATGGVSERTGEDLELSYRHSNLADTDVVVAATFRTVPRSRAEAEKLIREVTRWRKRHQPGGTLNAGSIFKNPPGDAAGRIIDEQGLKGLRIGDVAVSEKHANFFEAGPAATPQQIHDLVVEVRRRVKESTGLELEPEIRFVGCFVSS
jgi:UDP-N-acetylmuramate dehydrogenase